MRLRNAVLQTLTVFGSLGTLLCCALPALLVSVGAGAAVASLISAVPQLLFISEHKAALFVFAGVMLVISGASAYSNRNAPCPADPTLARSCFRMRRVSMTVFVASLLIYLTGFYFAFLAVA